MGIFSSSNDNHFLGIDIGNSSLKMVELLKKGKKISLSNYGFSENIEGADFTYSDDVVFLAKSIVKLKNELGIKTTKANASLPSWSVFSSVINLYNFDKKKINEQIIEEAKKVIPLPLEEMVLDWKIIPNKTSGSSNVKVFLTGSPKKLIKKYIDVFKEAKLTLANLETETFSLIRALLGNDPATVMIVEMGENSTDFSIVKESIPFLNRSINISGKSITNEISAKMGISPEQAEQFKFDLGMSKDEQKKDIPKVVLDAINPVVDEIKYMIDLFYNGNNENIEKIVLSGGGCLLYNFSDYLEKILDMRVVIGNPWFKVTYPPEIETVLSEVGPKLSVANGLALRGADKN
jgi:type IV pilus assembly protein PilM